MMPKYPDMAMQRARFEFLEEDGSYYGEIPGFQGVFSSAQTLEETRKQLAEVLESWLILRISRQLPIPPMDEA